MKAIAIAWCDEAVSCASTNGSDSDGEGDGDGSARTDDWACERATAAVLAAFPRGRAIVNVEPAWAA
jgi:hypothetical protein